MMFCPACEEDIISPQPDGICLTCGEELILQTSRNSTSSSRQQSSSTQNDAAAQNAMQLLASSMENQTPINPTALVPLMNQLQGDTTLAGMLGGGTTATNNDENVNDLAGILPPEALNPQAAGARLRPVSKVALDNLKRIVLTPQSAELFDAQISLFDSKSVDDLSPCVAVSNNSSKDGGSLTLNAVPGEFGPLSASSASKDDGDNSNKTTNQQRQQTAALVVCSPRTTKGGQLSTETLSEIDYLRKHRIPFIAYVERGDGITFVQKALVCQRAALKGEGGEESFCIGVIVGNTASGGKEVWPYVMQDNKKEAIKFGLKVPVVMIRRVDGQRLVKWASSRKQDANSGKYIPCQMKIHSKQANSHTCPICTDSYAPGDTIIRLPLCGHVFHEKCALAWLTKHNSCPYCRKELPTDDDDYERERRRREANAGVTEGDANGHNFYG